jgi:hypothetical protein
MVSLYDPIRKRLVTATPEERVRQALLQRMLKELGFPRGLLVVEAELFLIKRRADLLCYDYSHAPLLVVECKTVPVVSQAQEQLFGYNSIIGAPFLCLAWQGGVETLWREGNVLKRVPFLPPFRQLLV